MVTHASEVLAECHKIMLWRHAPSMSTEPSLHCPLQCISIWRHVPESYPWTEDPLLSVNPAVAECSTLDWTWLDTLITVHWFISNQAAQSHLVSRLQTATKFLIWRHWLKYRDELLCCKWVKCSSVKLRPILNRGNFNCWISLKYLQKIFFKSFNVETLMT